MSIIRLQSSDGEIFEVDAQLATKISGTIKNMLDDCGIDEDSIVPLPNVKASILRKVLQWANYHKDDPEDIDKKDNKADDIPPWDVDFLKVDQGTLFDLILAANYLDTKGLMKVACQTVAKMVNGKSPEEIRKTFDLRNDFSAEEQEQHRQEDQLVVGN